MHFIFLIHMLKLLGSVLRIIKLKIGIIITFNKISLCQGPSLFLYWKNFYCIYIIFPLPLFIESTFRINWARRKLKALSTQVNLWVHLSFNSLSFTNWASHFPPMSYCFYNHLLLIIYPEGLWLTSAQEWSHTTLHCSPLLGIEKNVCTRIRTARDRFTGSPPYCPVSLCDFQFHPLALYLILRVG